MSDLIGISTRALTAFQTAINTAGNNIVNANTEGYSRQTVSFSSEQGQQLGSFYLGNGVKIEDIERAFDSLLRADLINRTGTAASATRIEQLSANLQNLFAQPDFGAQGSIDEFAAALSDLSSDPASIPARQVVLSKAEILASRLNQLGDSVLDIQADVRAQVSAEVDQVNLLVSEIARLNGEIENLAGAGASPNDLLDQRDRLLVDLSERIQINTVQLDTGAVNVSLANGVALVSSVQSTTLEAELNEFGSEIVISQSGLAGSISREALGTSGSIGGALTFLDEMLQPAAESLGLMTLSMTELINEQQQNGLDLSGNAGLAMFSPLSVVAVESKYNTGSGSVSVDIDDISAFTASSYSLAFDGANWTLTNLENGSSTLGTGTLSMDGMEITFSGAANAGDRFLIDPSRGSLGQVNVALDDPSLIAAANPLIADENPTNSGSMSINGLSVSDTSSLPLATSIELTFNPDALGPGVPGFDVTGIAAGPLAYDPVTENSSKDFLIGGFSFEIKGVPDTSDRLVIDNNINATGDNSNLNAMLSVLDEKSLLGGTQNIADINGALVSDIGVRASVASSTNNIELELLNQAEANMLSLTGVNLDEEAADLLRYQQAYQAAAQVVAVAETLFNTLLEVTR